VEADLARACRAPCSEFGVAQSHRIHNIAWLIYCGHLFFVRTYVALWDRSFSIFGNSEASSVSSVSVQAPLGPHVVGLNLSFFGDVKIFLGDGVGTTTLLLSEGGGGVAEFLPGSKLQPDDNEQMKGFDFNCKLLFGFWLTALHLIMRGVSCGMAASPPPPYRVVSPASRPSSLMAP
jgi:hypothetical protein